MKKVLVFGATGNTGMYLVDYLESKMNKIGFQIIAIGRKNTDYFEKHGIEYVNLDITNRDEFCKLPTSDVYAICFTAAQLPTHESFVSPYQFLDVNVYGFLNVLEYARKLQVDRVLYTQTMSNIANVFLRENVIHPNMNKDFPYKGDHTMYVLSKNMGEELLKYYHAEYGIKKFVFHIPTIYQYRPDRFWYVDGIKKYRTFHHMIDLACEGKPLEMWGDPNSYKDLVYVKDYCQLIWRALLIDRNEGFYNVGTGVPTTLKTMLEGMVEIFSPKSRPSEIIPFPEKTNTPSYVIDITNAKEELGYEPEFGYLDMLRDFKNEMLLNRFVL